MRSTPQEWEQIQNLLHQIDVPPRQVLIDAKIYEVDLSGAFSAASKRTCEKGNATGRLCGSPPAGYHRRRPGVRWGLAWCGHSPRVAGHVLASAETHNNAKVISRPALSPRIAFRP